MEVGLIPMRNYTVKGVLQVTVVNDKKKRSLNLLTPYRERITIRYVRRRIVCMPKILKTYQHIQLYVGKYARVTSP